MSSGNVFTLSDGCTTMTMGGSASFVIGANDATGFTATAPSVLGSSVISEPVISSV